MITLHHKLTTHDIHIRAENHICELFSQKWESFGSKGVHNTGDKIEQILRYLQRFKKKKIPA